MSVNEWVVVRLKVQDKNRFMRDMKEAGYSTRALGSEVDKTGRLFSQGAHHGFLWNQMLFTIRRGLYFATLGVAALGAGVVALGFKFNIMMEQQQLAFKRFTGSVAGARKEVNFLFDLAAKGPFEFSNVIAASRQLMAFGFSVQRANQVLFNLQDAVAAMGLSQESLNRATLALGQIQSSGRLLGQDLRQLEQLGLVNPQDLAKRLGIRPEAIGNIGQLNVPSKYAIDAIMAYWQSRFKGAAKEFQATWTGQWSTIRDYVSRTSGDMLRPLFVYTRDRVFPIMRKVTEEVAAGQKRGGFSGALRGADSVLGTNLAGSFNAAASAAESFWNIIRPIGRDFFQLLGFFKIGTGALYAIGTALSVVAGIVGFLDQIHLLKVLIALWLADRTAVLLVAAATKAKLFWDAAELTLKKRKIFWTRVLVFWRGKETASILTNVRGWKRWATATGDFFDRSKGMYTQQYKNTGLFARMSRVLFTSVIPALTGAATAAWGFTVAMLANPVTWIIVGVVALIAGLVVLYFKWKRFHDLVNIGIRFIRDHWKILLLAVAPLLGPFTVAIALVTNLWGVIRRFANWLRSHNPFKWVGSVVKFFGGGGGDQTPAMSFTGNRVQAVTGGLPLPGRVAIPRGQTGTRVLTPGLLTVGERGRETLLLPRGAAVAPIGTSTAASLAGAAGGFGGRLLPVEIPVYIGKKRVAKATAEVLLDSKARR